ncbi:MAG: GNAT family N-acetyltransferase [Bdellovibrionales bacterium]|nr:GNAT family N-acetyltransferase [Bdellovibrionales bacterium]
MNLIPIERNGETIILKKILNPLEADVCRANAAMYERLGFQKPWIAYLAAVDQMIIGTCAFKGPPKNGAIEISYFTFPKFESMGFASQMASLLITIARQSGPDLEIVAHTLPKETASTKILKKKGFVNLGEIQNPDSDPNVPTVWKWGLQPPKKAK